MDSYCEFSKTQPRRNLHSGKFEFDRNLPLYLIFDFNRNPCTVIFGQFSRVYGVRILETIQAEGGINALLDKLEYLKLENINLRILGDHNGHRHIAETELTCYEIIHQRLGVRPDPATMYANRRLIFSREVCNQALYLEGLIKIADQGNEALIYDLKETLEKNGAIDKAKNDPHAGDAFRYFICHWVNCSSFDKSQ